MYCHSGEGHAASLSTQGKVIVDGKEAIKKVKEGVGAHFIHNMRPMISIFGPLVLTVSSKRWFEGLGTRIYAHI